MSTPVYAEREGAIATVVLNRPERMNTLDKAMVGRVVPDAALAEEGYACAQRIADGAPLVARWHKKFIRRLADPRPLGAEGYVESYACLDTEDFREGVAAFLAKRAPRFAGH